jgi:hypothetical protein
MKVRKKKGKKENMKRCRQEIKLPPFHPSPHASHLSHLLFFTIGFTKDTDFFKFFFSVSSVFSVAKKLWG